eukprot:snap_masked-scaffold_12-processed-gene-1.46-mRNA-1 protein AED:0.39 eAED:1.00 QI:0/-1/0/1/-1/1/1/0/136
MKVKQVVAAALVGAVSAAPEAGSAELASQIKLAMSKAPGLDRALQLDTCTQPELDECVDERSSVFGTPELILDYLLNGCDVFGPLMHDLYSCYTENCPNECEAMEEELQELFDASSRTCSGHWGGVCEFLAGPRPE